MGGKISPPETNGLKKEEITISLRAISKIEITGIKSYAKFDKQLNEVTIVKRQKEKKIIRRYAKGLIIKVTEKTSRFINIKKRIIKIHGIFEIVRFQRRSCKDGKRIKINSQK